MNEAATAAAALNTSAPAQFPDILQFLPSEEFRKQIDLYANDADMINKKGNMGGYTALHWSCIKNEFNTMKYLVTDCKANVNTKANLGETPLFICVKNANFLAIEFLTSYGANVYEKDVYERSVIHWSAYTGKIVLIYYFKRYHKIPINETDQFKQNALHIAVGCGHSDLARYLMNTKEFNYCDQDFNGNTAFHMAAKVGQSRLAWLLFKASGRRLLNIKNKLQQTAYEMIAFDTGAAQKRVADWLKFENKNHSDMYTNIMYYGAWLWRFTIPIYIYTLPLLFNLIVFNQSLSGYKGLIGYGSLTAFIYFVRHQSHRISHISGLQNPFFLGFFLNVFTHNYISYYTMYIGRVNFADMHQLFVMFLTVCHVYTLVKILMTEPGYIKQSCKKPDGSLYELRDLFRPNTQKTAPSKVDDVERENIFCEPCCVVIHKPTKHCKLCEHCCQRFDHHCLFLVKCIGINNHRLFILLLIFSVTCILTYLQKAFTVLHEQTRNLPEDAGGSVAYYFVSCSTTVWLTTLFITNAIAVFMLSFLLFFQLNILSHGFTAQFRPYNLKSMNLSLCDKLSNLKVFFFESHDKIMELYVRQAKAEYFMNKRYAKEKGDQEKLLGTAGILADGDEDEESNETNSFAGFPSVNNLRQKTGGHGHDCSSHGHSH